MTGRRDAEAGAFGRGQTTQDFAVGVSVFLLTVAFVLAYVPTVLTPVTSEADPAADAEAGRVASAVVGNLTVPGFTTRLDRDRTDRFFTVHDSSAAIRANYSLSADRSVNVTLRSLNGTLADDVPDPYAGDDYRDQTVGRASRVVTYNESRYRMVVRVW